MPTDNLPVGSGDGDGAAGTAVLPASVPDSTDVRANDRPWVTVVWNDPVNLMSYVTWVFCKLFGFSKVKAEKLMQDVHYKGRATVSTGPRERMEFDVSQLHGYGLWATVERQ